MDIIEKKLLEEKENKIQELTELLSKKQFELEYYQKYFKTLTYPDYIPMNSAILELNTLGDIIRSRKVIEELKLVQGLCDKKDDLYKYLEERINKLKDE